MKFLTIALSALIALSMTASMETLAKSKKSDGKDTKAATTTAKDKGAEKKDTKPAKEESKSEKKEEAKAPAADKEHEGMVFVKGYTKKDGTKVEGYWRKKSGGKAAK